MHTLEISHSTASSPLPQNPIASYPVQHKPYLPKPELFLIAPIFCALCSITLIVLDCIVLSQHTVGFYLAPGIWAGVIGIAVVLFGFIFLRYQTNCLAITVLMFYVIYVCASFACGTRVLMMVVEDQYARSHIHLELVRAIQTGVVVMCYMSSLFGVIQCVLICCATCTSCKRRLRKKDERERMKRDSSNDLQKRPQTHSERDDLSEDDLYSLDDPYVQYDEI